MTKLLVALRRLRTRFLLIIVAIPVAAFANRLEFERSIEHFKAGDFQQSQRILLGLVKAEPRVALYWFNLGNSYFKLGNYRGAERSFAWVEYLKSPLTPAARLYRGKALIMLGEAQKAKLLFESLSSHPSVPPAIKEKAQAELEAISGPAESDPSALALELYRAGKYQESIDFIATIQPMNDDLRYLRSLALLKLGQIDEANQTFSGMTGSLNNMGRASVFQDLLEISRKSAPGAKTFWLFGETSLGYGSNVYSAPGDQEARSAAIARLGIGLGGIVARTPNWRAIANYRFDWAETASAGDLKATGHLGSVVMSREDESVLFQVGPQLEAAEWANRAAVIKPALKLRYRRSISSREFGSDLSFSKVSPQQSELSYLDGTNIEARVYWGLIRFPYYAQLFFDVGKHQIGDQRFSDGSVLPWAHLSLMPGARVVYRKSDTWIFSGAVAYAFKSYATASQPGDKAREDRTLDIGLSTTMNFSAKLAPYLTTSCSRNSSTLGASDVSDQSYSAIAAFVGLLYDFY